MATTTQINRRTDRATSPGELVDPVQLVCPGCGEVVSCEPPASRENEPVPGFCHRDGSELCPDSSGTAGEPVECERLRWPA